jgi:hypothetical protein
LNTIKLVFSHYRYVCLAGATFVAMFLFISALSEYVFFDPYFVFYVPDDRIFGFVLILILSVLAAVVVAMNVYRFKTMQKKSKVHGGIMGSLIGASAGACSCGPVGFAVISTFGTAGGITTAFLSAYEIPLRIVSIGILGLVYYTTTKSLSVQCKV